MVMSRRPRPPKPVHKVEKAEGQTILYIVTSGRSGEKYNVTLDLSVEPVVTGCGCEGFRNRRTCSHVDAVLDSIRSELRATAEG